jgi:hypothetical protein
MMVTNLGTAHAAEKRLGVVAMDAVAEAVRLLVVDAVHREPTMQLVPRTSSTSRMTRARGRGRALAGRPADPVCEKFPDPFRGSNRASCGKHEGVGLDEPGTRR